MNGGYMKPANNKENRVDRRLSRNQNGKREPSVDFCGYWQRHAT
jgi:hypothetical protein